MPEIGIQISLVDKMIRLKRNNLQKNWQKTSRPVNFVISKNKCFDKEEDGNPSHIL